MSTGDARDIAARFGMDENSVGAYLRHMAVHLAADENADPDELVKRFAAASREFEVRFYDEVSAYSGSREGLRRAVVTEAYGLIREAAGDDVPRQVAYRLSSRKRAAGSQRGRG